MRQMRDRGRREEIKGDRRRDVTLMVLRGFCLHGCDAMHRQSMF